MKNRIKHNHKNMKKLFAISIFGLASLCSYSQAQMTDSLKEVLDKHEGKLNALDERVLVNETDLSKLNKLKISGYVQAQWLLNDNDHVTVNEPTNTFWIRRARLKFTYEALTGVKFVLQSDFSTGILALKDAYAVVNIPKLKDFTLWAGQFNRTNYEVEYSSSQREVLERSKVIRAIYPGEREVGVKLEYKGSVIPLKLQLMAMNGNFTFAQPVDYDSKKDLMGRLVYSIKLPGAGVGIDLGPNFYYGKTGIKYNTFVSDENGNLDSTTYKAGDYLPKQWMGGEIQIFADILGGMALKGEYVQGINSASSGTNQDSKSTLAARRADPTKLRHFSGYYLYLIKNIGKKNQFVFKYDFFDPNTNLSGDAAKSDVSWKTYTVAWQHYLNDNIRISLQYEMPKYEANVSRPGDYKDVTGVYGNTLGIRVQAKF
jgi:phosphate-selective porin